MKVNREQLVKAVDTAVGYLESTHSLPPDAMELRALTYAAEELLQQQARKIDGKFHVDVGEIVKTASGEIVPHDEPVFLLRGRDHLALAAVEHYAALCKVDGCNDWQLEGIRSEVERFRAFAEAHPDRMKQPGITKGLPWKGEKP